jgi:hypothetical protein
VSSGIEAGAPALDAAGNLYAAGSASVWRITSDGTSHVFAGGGSELIPPSRLRHHVLWKRLRTHHTSRHRRPSRQSGIACPDAPSDCRC